MKLVVGLGNPGKQYEKTRHNVGFRVIDEIARRWGIEMATEKFHGWFGAGAIRGTKIALLKPTTFMNRSGQSVLAAGKFYKVELPDLLVIVDDLALPLGRLRIRKAGSAGGHNGLKDIAARLGSQDYCRLRFGIGEAPGSATSHVLAAFAPSEEPDVESGVSKAADAVEKWLAEGPDSAMNAYNV